MPGPVPIHNAIPVSHTVAVQLCPSRPNRRSIVIYNDSTEDLYVKYDSGIDLGAARSFMLRIPPNWLGRMPWGDVFEGAVWGLWEAASPAGFAQVTELVN